MACVSFFQQVMDTRPFWMWAVCFWHNLIRHLDNGFKSSLYVPTLCVDIE
ncbi:unnamed protein product [Meloidogyne enterolobii]|uniref:Uncharacterized protein n=1 Tax=Meloidogyne enterolobii TaxID=390850 RepID=A0ACB0YA65_MELEN